jgi:hypothetical protein
MFDYFNQPSKNIWNKYKGQTLILSESNTPWYEKIKEKKEPIVIMKQIKDESKAYYNNLCIIIMFIIILIILLNSK